MFAVIGDVKKANTQSGSTRGRMDLTLQCTLKLTHQKAAVDCGQNLISMTALLVLRTTTTIHPFNSLLSRTTRVSRYQKDKTSLDLNKASDDGVLGWQWHQLDNMQTIYTLHQTDNHTNTSSFNFYRLDALPGSQPTVSKHRRQDSNCTRL